MNGWAKCLYVRPYFRKERQVDYVLRLRAPDVCSAQAVTDQNWIQHESW